MKRPHWITLAALGFCACVTVPKLSPDVPDQGLMRARTEGQGVTLEVLPNAWQGAPGVVAESYTPLAVRLANGGDQAFDLTYAAFTLIDETGRLYRAVPPMEVVRALLGQGEPEPLGRGAVAMADAPETPELLAQLSIGFGNYDPAYGPPGAYDPYGGGYLANRSAAAHLLDSGLREGRLLPRTQAQGFLYFQQAYGAKHLTLHVEAPSEQPGGAPLVLESGFSVGR
jgi:hypothetical protein